MWLSRAFQRHVPVTKAITIAWAAPSHDTGASRSASSTSSPPAAESKRNGAADQSKRGPPVADALLREAAPSLLRHWTEAWEIGRDGVTVAAVPSLRRLGARHGSVALVSAVAAPPTSRQVAADQMRWEVEHGLLPVFGRSLGAQEVPKDRSARAISRSVARASEMRHAATTSSAMEGVRTPTVETEPPPGSERPTSAPVSKPLTLKVRQPASPKPLSPRAPTPTTPRAPAPRAQPEPPAKVTVSPKPRTVVRVGKAARM